MYGSMVGIQSEAAEIRRGIKKIDRKKSQGKNIMSNLLCSVAIMRGSGKVCIVHKVCDNNVVSNNVVSTV